MKAVQDCSLLTDVGRKQFNEQVAGRGCVKVSGRLSETVTTERIRDTCLNVHKDGQQNPGYCFTNEKTNTPGRIRTCDLRFRRPLLYPAELRALDVFVCVLSFRRLS